MGSDELPPTDDRPAYKIRVLITNIPAPGGERSDKLGPKPLAPADLRALANGRCGYAERAHDDLKNGLAAETMPCGRFGANAAWWRGAVLAHNLHAWMADRALAGDLRTASWKRIRATILIHPARVVRRARQCVLVMRRAGTDALQAAFAQLAQSTAPG